jgi:hypothetical protein
VHFRLPSFARGVTAFVWAVVLALYVWIGLLAIGVKRAEAFIFALLAFGAIFLFVRLRGGDTPGT